MISEESYQDLCRAFIPAVGDVLLAVVGATLGKTAIVPSDIGRHHIQRSVAIFRPELSLLVPEFLNYLFQSAGFQSLLWEYTGFSAQPGVYLGTLANFKLVIPSVTEQRALVNGLLGVVDKLDTLFLETLSVISMLYERRSALISAAVTGKIDVRNYVAKELA